MSKIYFGSSALAMLAGICFAAEGSGSGGGGEDRAAKVRDALKRLDESKDDDWTEGGRPKTDRVRELSGLSDLKASEIGEAGAGYTRENRKFADAAPAEGKNSELDKATENIAPNSDPKENPNVGRTDLSPAEGQAHTSDQRELLAAAMTEDSGGAKLDASDPIALIEAAIAAANADERYRRNGPLQQFLRHYMVDQVNIRAHQGRLDARTERREEERKSAAS